MPTVDPFLPDFIQSTFFSGYTIFNTVVYTLILVVFVYFIIKMFKKIDIDPESIIFSLIPFIFLGCSTRALVDNYIYPKTVFLITPGLYIWVGLLTIASLLFSVFLFKRTGIDYKKVLFCIGIVLCIPNLLIFPTVNTISIVYVLLTWISVSILFLIFMYILSYTVGRFSKDSLDSTKCDVENKINYNNSMNNSIKNSINNKNYLNNILDNNSYNKNSNFFKKILHDKIYLSILAVHLFDASTTFVAVEYFNYSEQHVLANALYKLFDTSLTMFPMKLIVILSVLYLIDQYFDDLTIKNLLKLAVFVLGLAPGLRNFLTLAIGTI